MFSSCAKLLVALTMSLALVAAPCKNCQPKAPAQQQEDPQQKHCGHDCCPKPKPAQKSCSWQPADFDAVENAKNASVAIPTMVELPLAPSEPAPVTAAAFENVRPAFAPSPPPVYLSTSNLRF